MANSGGTVPAESLNLRLVGHSDMNGQGVTMQLVARGDYLYVAHFTGAGRLQHRGRLRSPDSPGGKTGPRPARNPLPEAAGGR